MISTRCTFLTPVTLLWALRVRIGPLSKWGELIAQKWIKNHTPRSEGSNIMRVFEQEHVLVQIHVHVQKHVCNCTDSHFGKWSVRFHSYSKVPTGVLLGI